MQVQSYVRTGVEGLLYDTPCRTEIETQASVPGRVFGLGMSLPRNPRAAQGQTSS